MSGNGARPGLPDGWAWRKLGDIADCRLGKMLDKEKNVGEPRPYLRNINVQWGSFDLDNIKEMRITAAEIERYEVRSGDLLVCEGGEPGRCAVWRDTRAMFFQKALHRVRPDETILADYLHHYLRFAALSGRLAPLFTGTTIKHLPGVKLAQVAVARPPLDQQRQIVETIERRLADISLGSSMLGGITGRFEAFHASLREAACLGTLLDRHRDRPGGGDGPSPLPDGWEWKSLAEMATDGSRSITDGPFGSNLKSSHYTDSGPRVIRLQNVGDGVFLDARAHISPGHFEMLRAHEARAGDVVLASLGDDLPRACVVPDWLGPAIVKADCPRVRPAPNVNPYFLAECLNSRPIRQQAATAVHGMGRRRLKLADAKRLKVPLPPLGEQHEIVARLTDMQSGARRLEHERDEALTAAEVVRWALLRDAMGNPCPVAAAKGRLKSDDANG